MYFCAYYDLPFNSLREISDALGALIQIKFIEITDIASLITIIDDFKIKIYKNQSLINENEFSTLIHHIDTITKRFKVLKN